MATVGVVEWSLAGARPSRAKIRYHLLDAADSLNRGGEAPVDLNQPRFRTLLLGLKQVRDYGFQIEATRGSVTCRSESFTLPTTGSYPDANPVAASVVQPDKRRPGFIVTSSGTALPASAFIIDADGAIVWFAPGPATPTRALLDFEGQHLWMLALNLTNEGGEMRTMALDGSQEQRNVAGLENTHHDFTVLPGGKIAALSWKTAGIDPESELLVRAVDGSVERLFTIGSNLYRAESYHANSLHYVPFDGGFTVSDRNPNLIVKVSAHGVPEWQLGGDCDGAPALACSPQAWQVNHGHHLLDDGTFLLFNNGNWIEAHVLQFQTQDVAGGFAPRLVKDYAGTGTSSNLGDVQRLPGGNTLVTYSASGSIVELDADWNEVQTFSARVGYTSWRASLYGAPERP